MDMKMKRALAAICAFLFVAGIFLLGGCGITLERKQSESGFEGYDEGHRTGFEYGQGDKEHFEKTGELLSGRRPPDPHVPSYVDEETYKKAFVIGFYEGYDKAFPESQDIPPVGMEETEGEDPEIDLDVEIFDDYQLGFNEAKIPGYNAGFDDGLHGTETEIPEITGKSEEYVRGFCDGWAEGYEEGYQRGVEWKETKEMGP